MKIKKVIIHTVDILMFVQDSTGSVSDKETMVWKRPDFIPPKNLSGARREKCHTFNAALLKSLHCLSEWPLTKVTSTHRHWNFDLF